MEIDKKLYEEIKQYCDLNGLKPKEYINDLLKKAFMEDKYGKMPSVLVKKSKPETETLTVEKKVKIINDFAKKMDEGMKEADKLMEEMAKEGGSITEEDMSELIFNSNPLIKESKTEEKPKENVNLPKSKKVKL